MDPTDLLKLLLDPDRLAVAGVLAAAGEDGLTSDDVAGASGVGRRDVLETLAALAQGGVVARRGDGWVLDATALRAVARRVATVTPPPDPEIGFGMTGDEQQVLARWFEGRHLRELPSKRSARLVVLERLALEFEPGRRYEEREVNELLAGFLPEPEDDRNPDWSSLRRALVDEGMLDRERNVYWRSGGRVV